MAAPHPTRAIHWPYVVPIAAVHVLALSAFAPWLFSWSGLSWMLAGIHIYGTIGINLCYHRLLTHRSFWLPAWLEHVFATLALCCLQDTPVRWVATHRLHHNHSDEEDRDPHSPQDDFVWGHMGWLLRRNAETDWTRLSAACRSLLAIGSTSFPCFIPGMPVTCFMLASWITSFDDQPNQVVSKARLPISFSGM